MDEQEPGPVSVVCQFGFGVDRFDGWSPLIDLVQHETGPDHGVHVGGNRSVFFDNAVHEPGCHSLTFNEVVVKSGEGNE